MSNQPIENAARNAANGNTASMSAVDAAANPDTGSVKLPTTEELLAEVQKSQQSDAAVTIGAQPQPTYTPNTSSSEQDSSSSAPGSGLDTVTLMRAMSHYIKAQNSFLHNEKLPAFATAMETHIIALTTALEQLGVL